MSGRTVIRPFKLVEGLLRTSGFPLSSRRNGLARSSYSSHHSAEAGSAAPASNNPWVPLRVGCAVTRSMALSVQMPAYS